MGNARRLASCGLGLPGARLEAIGKPPRTKKVDQILARRRFAGFFDFNEIFGLAGI
jgi:hypothetical protein